MFERPPISRRRILTATLGAPVAAAASLLAAPRPALAGSLDSYRQQGVIAERFDGFVELRAGTGPAEAKQIVERVNAKRRDIYKTRAKREGVPLEAVGKLYAEEIWEQAPGGTYLKKPGGDYVRK
jgi:hypothetical protein